MPLPLPLPLHNVSQIYIVFGMNRTESSTIMWFSFELHHQNTWAIIVRVFMQLFNSRFNYGFYFGTWCSFFAMCVCARVFFQEVDFSLLFLFGFIPFYFSRRVSWANLDPFQKLNRTTFILFFVRSTHLAWIKLQQYSDRFAWFNARSAQNDKRPYTHAHTQQRRWEQATKKKHIGNYMSWTEKVPLLPNHNAHTHMYILYTQWM